ncbi:hypothetical protein [Domibacillus robiginosus]|uniref:hypothetical protein n=1 Tax=Domibacillus robiginosus TaxID=1071054 RepID=UPI00067B0ADE|nr:hypothetical protein [Domibacillus robiginosus]
MGPESPKNRKRHCGRCRITSAPLEGKDETGQTFFIPPYAYAAPAGGDGGLDGIHHSYADGLD